MNRVNDWVEREARNYRGEWTTGGSAESGLRAVAGGRQKVQTPTQFMHPDTGIPMGKSEIGDTFEHLFRTRGAAMLREKYGGPYIMIAGSGNVTGKGRTSRTTALDFKIDETHGGELKTLNVNAANQKTAIKKEEQDRKNAAVAEAGLKPLLIVQVVDMRTRTVHVYAYPAFSSKAVSRMDHLGSYQFSARDFRNAQTQTGHWQQRVTRAESYGRPGTPRPTVG
jgi:hypothetical protein